MLQVSKVLIVLNKLYRYILSPIIDIKIFNMLADVCADLKTRRGCAAGSRHEVFMKKNCKKTCGLCGIIINIYLIHTWD